jgi:transcription elongation factor/antiterminator RfaH
VQGQPKHEHIAAAHLRQANIEIWLPRIRFKKSSVRGPVWFTEVLFPSYLFARFDWQASLRLVHHTAGVSKVVSFGGKAPRIPDEVIAELKETIGDQEVLLVPETLQTGEPVQIAGGAFHGLTAVVTRVYSARERVRVLLDFLGRQTAVDLPVQWVVPEEAPRRRVPKQG